MWLGTNVRSDDINNHDHSIIERPSINKWLVIKGNIYTKKLLQKAAMLNNQTNSPKVYNICFSGC
jgi:hypothetical protein